MPILRRLLLCFLMLVLPLQGAVAAALMQCVLPAAQQTAAAPAHNHHAAHQGQHHQQQHAAAVDGQAADDPTAGDLQHKCASCGACHAAALLDTALPDAVHALPQPQLTQAPDALTGPAPHKRFKPPRA